MDWTSIFAVRAWTDRACSLAFIKSIPNLKVLHIRMTQVLPTMVMSDRSRRFSLNTSMIERYKILPLQTVNVIITNFPNELFGNVRRPHAELVAFAEALRQRILDPRGLERFEAEQARDKRVQQELREEQAQRKRAQLCGIYSTDEECAGARQARQDAKDVREGRSRKTPKIVGACGAGHVCVICRIKPSQDGESYQRALICTRPGKCDQPVSPDEASAPP